MSVALAASHAKNKAQSFFARHSFIIKIFDAMIFLKYILHPALCNFSLDPKDFSFELRSESHFYGVSV